MKIKYSKSASFYSLFEMDFESKTKLLGDSAFNHFWAFPDTHILEGSDSTIQPSYRNL